RGSQDKPESEIHHEILYFYERELQNSNLTYDQFRARAGIKTYYVYIGDKMVGASSYLQKPKFRSGYSFADISREGNKIYAIPIYTFQVQFLRKEIYFWMLAERSKKMYMIANATMDLKTFRQEFSKHSVAVQK